MMAGTPVMCEESIRGQCNHQRCPLYHHTLPYLWQIEDDHGWHSLTQESLAIETAFAHPNTLHTSIKVTANSNTDGSSLDVHMDINFDEMKAQLVPAGQAAAGKITNIRRLSTVSYIKAISEESKSEPPPALYVTQWRWYWQAANEWKMFGQVPNTPLQSVLEAKYLHGQEVYRFEVDHSDSSDVSTFLLNFKKLTLQDMADRHWRVRRRPLLVTTQAIAANIVPENPPVQQLSFPVHLPEDWYPIDPTHDYELVPLNPESIQYHLIASEFLTSLQQGREILDVFRIQNPFLWNKYHCKKQYMTARQKQPVRELQLFHGTTQAAVVQAIFRQNFDWRISGKNATMYGKGAYFAKDAAFSDRYTGGNRGPEVRWMFLVRVLVGKYTQGQPDHTRPPPLDSKKPHGDLYDSCVNNMGKPTIYVIFDSDQYYPEYVISYRFNSATKAFKADDV